MTHNEINNLPVNIKNEIMETLRAYNTVNVWYENGEYHVMTGSCIKAQYGKDHQFIGTVNASDVYNEDERTENYCNSFADFPAGYKGLRDYPMMREIKKSGYTKKVKLENGNIVLA